MEKIKWFSNTRVVCLTQSWGCSWINWPHLKFKIESRILSAVGSIDQDGLTKIGTRYHVTVLNWHIIWSQHCNLLHYCARLIGRRFDGVQWDTLGQYQGNGIVAASLRREIVELYYARPHRSAERIMVNWNSVAKARITVWLAGNQDALEAGDAPRRLVEICWTIMIVWT